MVNETPQKCLKKFRNLNSTLLRLSVLCCPQLLSLKEMSRIEF